nr:MAG TPA: hypothetical protein [Caudoviricetes sp.]
MQCAVQIRKRMTQEGERRNECSFYPCNANSGDDTGGRLTPISGEGNATERPQCCATY